MLGVGINYLLQVEFVKGMVVSNILEIHGNKYRFPSVNPYEKGTRLDSWGYVQC